jgi:hypothetical protein
VREACPARWRACKQKQRRGERETTELCDAAREAAKYSKSPIWPVMYRVKSVITPGLLAWRNSDPLSHSAKARISHAAEKSIERCTDWLRSGRAWMQLRLGSASIQWQSQVRGSSGHSQGIERGTRERDPGLYTSRQRSEFSHRNYST